MYRPQDDGPTDGESSPVYRGRELDGGVQNQSLGTATDDPSLNRSKGQTEMEGFRSFPSV